MGIFPYYEVSDLCYRTDRSGNWTAFMAFTDYIWLIKLIVELLKLLGRLDANDFSEVAEGVKRARDLMNS